MELFFEYNYITIYINNITIYCIKYSQRYGNLSEQGIFKNEIQKKEGVATSSLSAISFKRYPQAQGTIKIQKIYVIVQAKIETI